MRRVMGIVCLLVLSMGTLFSAVHDHHGDAPAGHSQCAACAWQSQATGDLPVSLSLPARPDTFVISVPVDPVITIDQSVRVHPSRGPPLPL